MPCAYGFESLRPHHNLKRSTKMSASFFCEVRGSAAAAALLATANNSADNSSQQPPNWATRISLRNSVPERGFSCTESTRGTVEGLLRYATHFLRHSVLKTGFYGTEAIFGVRKGLLWYGRDIRCGAGGRKTTPERTTKAHRQSTPPEHKRHGPDYATVPKDCSAEHKR